MKITKGDLIISSKPFTFALSQSERDKRCDQCFKTLRTRILCYKCLKVMFCSRKCQTESTAQGNHTHECPILATRPLTCMTRLITRVLTKLENSGESDVEVICGHKRDWNCLMDHYENVVKDPGVMLEFESIFDELVLIFGNSLPDIKTVITIYGKLLINSFAVLNEYMRQIGRALYLGPSIFDHSCQPSASFIFIGTTIYIKAMKSLQIKAITDLKISYIDEFETTYERQRLLSASYYFQCDCNRCISNEMIFTKEDKNLRKICERIEHLTQECKNCFDYIESTDSIAENDNIFIKELVSQLRPNVMSLNTVLEVKIAEFVAFNDKNIELLIKIIEILKSFYGECHQRLALKLYQLAMFAQNHPTLRRQLLTEAKTIAIQITPDFKEFAMNCNHKRSRPMIPYSNQGLISNSFIDSTLLYRIDSQLIDRKYFKTYKLSTNFSTNENICRSKQRSRSYGPAIDYQSLRYRQLFN